MRRKIAKARKRLKYHPRLPVICVQCIDPTSLVLVRWCVVGLETSCGARSIAGLEDQMTVLDEEVYKNLDKAEGPWMTVGSIGTIRKGWEPLIRYKTLWNAVWPAC